MKYTNKVMLIREFVLFMIFAIISIYFASYYRLFYLTIVFMLASFWLRYKDYKIIIYDNLVEFYSYSLKKNLKIRWQEINGIEIKKSYPNKIVGIKINITIIYSDNKKRYHFNINPLINKEMLMKKIFDRCVFFNIPITDLTSNEMVLYTNVIVRMKRFFKGLM